MTVPLPSLSEDLTPICAALNQLNHDERIAWMRGLSGKELKALYDLASDGGELSIEHFYSAEGQVVIHHGQNSLPAFNHFQKRVCIRSGCIQGYNHQTLAWLTGPGHFTLRQDGPQEVLFDYITLPESVPDAFPALAPNNKGVSRLVYAGMIDRVRRVSDHCVIGAAFKGEKDIGARFMLTREDGATDTAEGTDTDS